MSEIVYGNLTDQELYDHHIIYQNKTKPKEKNILVSKDHFQFLNFANFRPSSYVTPEKPGRETNCEMLTFIFSFRTWAKCVGTGRYVG